MGLNEVASDEMLALRLKKGHSDAFDELMSRYKGRLYAFICRYIADRDEAYDLLQESFITIYQKIDLYDQERQFSPWAFQITLNKCRDWGRKNTLRRLLPFSSFNRMEDDNNFLDNIVDPGANPELILIDKIELENLAKAVAKLPDKLKSPLIMCVLENMSQDECATILGVSRKTIETRIYRARKKLAEATN
ncbi:MAG: RNA polymerase sigma factor [Alphaproteobacteria bacterium]|nr:RNA polymerase sigma factor [Alphaproteobacteria bacterium]